LFGGMFNWGLWGILTSQVFIYYLHFNDSRNVKILVYGVYLLECMQTGMASAEMFHWFSHGWGRLDILQQPYTNPFSEPIIDGIVSLIVQLYFIWRIWMLGRSKILVVIIAI
ncbi:hypothetical protein GALMADRAFT_28460, partial [Galerina marginata CBS 339.88]